MKNVQQLKKDLNFNMGLMNLLDVMKKIAVVQFRTLERNRQKFTKLRQIAKRFFQRVDFTQLNHPFVKPKTERLGIVMVTSDEGFMGGLNTRVINNALDLPGAESAQLIVVGSKGADYLEDMGRKCVVFRDVNFDRRYDFCVNLRDYLVDSVRNGQFGKLVFVYPLSISFINQQIKLPKILPISEISIRRKDDQPRRPIIIESALEDMADYLVGVWIFYELLQVIEESKLSEFAARTIQLEKSHQELTRQGKRIKFHYYKAYHGIIDKDIRETFLSSLMRKKGH
jgi:ATP synthase F1 gamma subunit